MAPKKKPEEKPKPMARTAKPALSHDDEELPPARAVAQAKREAEFRRLVGWSQIDRIRKKPRV